MENKIHVPNHQAVIESVEILKNFWQFYTESRQVCGSTIPKTAQGVSRTPKAPHQSSSVGGFFAFQVLSLC